VKDWKKPAFFAICVAVVVAIDHAAKWIAFLELPEGIRHSCLWDFLRLEAAHNTGAILGLGSQLPEGIRVWILPAMTAAVLIWVSILLIRERDTGVAFLGLSLVWGGGFSNLVDRLACGNVFDFFNLGIGSVRTGTSNLADVAIVAGIPLIIIGWLRSERGRRRESTEIPPSERNPAPTPQ
jgi:signal peptidase II